MPAKYTATILRDADGHAQTKTFRNDPYARPKGHTKGSYRVIARTIRANKWVDFVAQLAELKTDECLIRGRVRPDVRREIKGKPVRRLAYDQENEGAPFEPCERNWIVLDADHTDTPFDPDDVSGSVAAWKRTLPHAIRRARSAFFLSANAHRSKTVRGKLIVHLDEPLDDTSAAAWAKSNGFDPCVCHAVQPNYLAAPVFDGCEDPLPKRARKPFIFEGLPASLPRFAQGSGDPLGARNTSELAPDDIPSPSRRAKRLAKLILPRWLEGDRMGSNAALHLFGWLLARGWDRLEIASMLQLLHDAEPDLPRRKERDQWRALQNARSLDAPGAAREWLGTAFDKVDRIVNGRLKSESITEREDGSDPWDDETDFTKPEEPIEYLCEGLRLAASDGKVSVVGGQPAASKGPVADHLAVCFAMGLKAFERFECKKCPVGILDFEGRRLTSHRVRRIARAYGLSPAKLQGRLHLKDARELGDLRSPETFEQLQAWIKRLGILMLILDSYTSAMLGLNVDQNSPEYASLMKALGSLGICVICVAHANKSSGKSDQKPGLGDLTGSGALASLTQTAIMVWKPDRTDDNRIAVTCARSPDEPFADFEARWSGSRKLDEPLTLRVEDAPVFDEAEIAAAGSVAKAATRSVTEKATERCALERNVERLLKALGPLGHTRWTEMRLARQASLVSSGQRFAAAIEAAEERGLIEVNRDCAPICLRPTKAYRPRISIEVERAT